MDCKEINMSEKGGKKLVAVPPRYTGVKAQSNKSNKLMVHFHQGESFVQ